MPAPGPPVGAAGPEPGRMNGNSCSVPRAFIFAGQDDGMFQRTLLLCAAGLLLAAAPLRAVERPLRVDFDQSRIDIVVKATVDSFTGRLAAYEPSLTLGNDGRITGARIAFHFRDVFTGKAKRDQAMHGWQHTDEFPDGEFVLDALEPAGLGQARARGRLIFHGVAREITFPVTVTREDSTYAIDGDAAIDVREHGLPAIRMMGLLKVDPVVHVKFHLQGRAGDEV